MRYRSTGVRPYGDGFLLAEQVQIFLEIEAALQ